MKSSSTRRAGAAALALAISLAVTTPLLAQRPRERDPRDVRERIVRIIKKVLGAIGVNDDIDGTTPPKP